MQRFFLDIDTLDQHTHNLNVTPIRCPHCQQHGQLISHGFVYKQRSSTQRETIGKRVFCSNRNHHQGCGRTVQLYLAHIIPQKNYDAFTLWIFITALLTTAAVSAAYHRATDQDNPRQAWRWLRSFYRHLSRWRSSLQHPKHHEPSQQAPHRSPKRQTLLETWQELFPLYPSITD